MRIYRSLQLTTPHMQQLAARWGSWCRRRAALSSKLTTSIRNLLDMLPTKRMLPMRIIEPLCIDSPHHPTEDSDTACMTKQYHDHAAPAGVSTGQKAQRRGHNACENLLAPLQQEHSAEDASTQWHPFWNSTAEVPTGKGVEGAGEHTSECDSELTVTQDFEEDWRSITITTGKGTEQSKEYRGEGCVEVSVEAPGAGGRAVAWEGELVQHLRHGTAEEGARRFVQHEPPMHGMEQVCESNPDGMEGTCSAQASHSDAWNPRCLHGDHADATPDEEGGRGHAYVVRKPVAIPKERNSEQQLTQHAVPATAGRGQQAAHDGGLPCGGDLLGCSAHVTAAVQRVLREVEDLHKSDALMHFETCWPHTDLTEVCYRESSCCCVSDSA